MQNWNLEVKRNDGRGYDVVGEFATREEAVSAAGALQGVVRLADPQGQREILP